MEEPRPHNNKGREEGKAENRKSIAASEEVSRQETKASRNQAERLGLSKQELPKTLLL
jgi:hypothetical protein